MDPRRSGSVNEEAMFRDKHQVLLQGYLVLQKESVSKKRKLADATERKEALLDEIRFLKQRRDFLLKAQGKIAGQREMVLQSQRRNAKYNAEPSGRALSAREPTFHNHSLWNSGGVGKEKLGFPSLRIGKKPKHLLRNGRRAEKRKISWQDQLALKA